MAADNEVNAKLTADTEEAVDNVEELGDSFDDAAKKANQAGDKLADFGGKLDKLGSRMTSIGGALSVGLTAPIVGVAGAAINMGLNAVEAENLFTESFGAMADRARAWSEETSDALGLNEFELRRNSATIFAMTNAMGLSKDASFDMATGITKLSNDMASFFNLDPQVAFDKLRAGISGEAEPLKQLGILVTENMIKQTDFAKAILATGRQLTEQEKVQARYQAILQQTSVAQGDLERTLDSPANKLRVMSSRIEETTTKLGMALLPALEAILPLFDKGVSVIEDIVDAFAKADPAIQTVVIVLGGLLAAAGPVLVVLGQVVGAVGTLTTAIAAGGGLMAVLGSIGAFIGGTLLPLLGALAVGIALGGAVGIAIAEFLEWLGVIESTEEKTRRLLETMEPSSQQVRAMADASKLAGREITDWAEATEIMNDHIMALRNGSEEGAAGAAKLAAGSQEAADAAEKAGKAEEMTAEATKKAAEAAKKAADARQREAEATKRLADQLGTTGLVRSMQSTGKALDELNRRGEKLSSAGLDQVIKQVAKLKAEGVELEGGLKRWDDRVKEAARNLPSLSSALEGVPAPELTEDIAKLTDGVEFATEGLDPFNDKWFETVDAMTDAERAALGMPPALKEPINATELLSATFEDLANVMRTFGLEADSIAGQMVGLAGSFISAIPAVTSFKDSVLGNDTLSRAEKFQGVASGIASGIAGVASATSSGGAGASAGKGALAGAAAGAQVAGPIGAAVGAIGGAVVGFFRGRGRDKMRKEIEQVVGVSVSEDLAKAIKDAAKKAERSLADQALLSLGTIFAETGVEEFEGGVSGAAESVIKLMQKVEDGTLPAKEGVEAIGQAFSELAAQTLEAGRIADAGLLDIVKNAQQMGEEVPEIAAFIEQSLAEAARGISKVIGGIKIADPQDAQDQATIFAGAFFATVEEVGLLEAVDAFGPAFDKLKEQLSDLGIEGIDFGGVQRLFDIAGQEEFRPLLEGVQGLNEGLVGLANSGYLTADSFSAFQRQGEAAFEQLQAAGLNQNEALQQMAPFLQSAIDAAERFGIPLDENTQKMIAQAEAAGIAFETDPMNRMADALVLVAELLGATDEQLQGLSGTASGLPEAFDQTGEKIAGLPDVAAESVEGIRGAFEEGSASITEGLDPIAEKMANEIVQAGETTSSAINSSFDATNKAIEDGLGKVSDTFISQVAPAADRAAKATDGIAEAARRAAEAAKSIEFPEGPAGGGADTSAAAGFTGILGRDTIIQAHAGEFVNIIPRAQTSQMDFRSAQKGMGPGPMSFNMGNTTIVMGSKNGKDERGRPTVEVPIDEFIEFIEDNKRDAAERLKAALGIQ